jgi:ATP-dependent Clp protease adaptor protein ClpS
MSIFAPVPRLAPKPVMKPVTQSRPPPRYKLLLHDDKFNEGRYVVKVLARIICNMTMEEAEEKMMEAHLKGVSLLRVCPQDEAEDYCEKIRYNGVKSTVEPA